MGIVFFILAVVFIWLIVLTYFTYNISRFFKKLSQDVARGNIIDILTRVVDKESQNSQNINELKTEIAKILEDGAFHIQRIGFVRFNPFEELGGDHSFSVAILDGLGTGIIITGLHTRERTRVYVKNIKQGKSEVELSHEEKKALKIAQKS